MRLKLCGAAKLVTGSCIYIQVHDKNILIDCGMFQGTQEEENRKPFPFDPKNIDYLILTHAHIDHCGRILLLVRQGFKGKIVCTDPTAKIANIMLLDAAKVMYENYKTMLRKLERTGKVPPEPLYDEYDVLESLPLFSLRLPYYKEYRISNNISVTLKNSGHILGSAFVELKVYEDKKEKKIIFSGDLGNKNKPIVDDPDHPSKADYVFIEGTYGDRNHRDFRASKEELLDAIKYAFSRNGNVLIPSYALERAQEVLFVLREFYDEGKLPKCKIFLDSPLAISITKIFLSNPDFYDRETYKIFLEKNPFDLPNLYLTKDVEESKSINTVTSGAIIIAGSGMLTGGRILHHLKYNLWREECALVFIGYQPEGTLGRKIIDGADVVKIFGEDISVKAKIYTINGFSSHADQAGLLEWLSYTQNPKKVFLVHGEEQKLGIFKDAIHRNLGLDAYIPSMDQELEL